MGGTAGNDLPIMKDKKIDIQELKRFTTERIGWEFIKRPYDFGLELQTLLLFRIVESIEDLHRTVYEIIEKGHDKKSKLIREDEEKPKKTRRENRWNKFVSEHHGEGTIQELAEKYKK